MSGLRGRRECQVLEWRAQSSSYVMSLWPYAISSPSAPSLWSEWRAIAMPKPQMQNAPGNEAETEWHAALRVEIDRRKADENVPQHLRDVNIHSVVAANEPPKVIMGRPTQASAQEK